MIKGLQNLYQKVMRRHLASKEIKINLSDFLEDESINLTLDNGSRIKNIIAKEKNGRLLRKYINLDELDCIPNHVIIQVPGYVHLITPTAFNELFAPSINALGEETFRKKYKIICNDKFYESMNECIDKVQNRSNWIYKY